MSYQLADGSLSTDYKEGDLFVGGFVGVNEETPQFVEGSIVRLELLDDTCCPCFELVEGAFSDTVEPFCNNSIYEDWACLKKYTVKEQDPEVIIKQSDAFVRITQDEYDSLIDEVNMLRELVAELTFKPVSEMTPEDWKQAERERWVFQTEHRGLVITYDVDCQPHDSIPILLEDGNGDTWYVGLDGKDIDQEGWTVVKRVK